MTEVNPQPTELIVALDYPEPSQAEQLISHLEGLPLVCKVGSELYLKGGPDFVRKLVDQGHRVFLDLKFHDIPNTVARAVSQTCRLGVEMVTLHLSGGESMVKAAVQAARVAEEQGSRRPRILGVSVLTSFSQEEWSGVVSAFSEGEPRAIDSSVEAIVAKGTEWGVDGIVCSTQEVGRISQKWPHLLTVVPGIRPAGMEKGDQSRAMTPRQAREAGAKAIVVGRAINQAELPDGPREMAERILADIQ